MFYSINDAEKVICRFLSAEYVKLDSYKILHAKIITYGSNILKDKTIKNTRKYLQ